MVMLPQNLVPSFSLAPPVLCHAALCSGNGQQPIRKIIPDVVGRIKFAKMFTYDLRLLVLFDSLGASVPILNDAVPIQRDNSIVFHLGDHFMISLFVLSQLLDYLLKIRSHRQRFSGYYQALLRKPATVFRSTSPDRVV